MNISKILKRNKPTKSERIKDSDHPTPMDIAPVRKERLKIDPSKFVTDWNKASSLKEIMELYGLSHNQATVKASTLRRSGYTLKRMLPNGDKDFWRKTGAMGGKKGKTGGFFANRELARRAGRIGGSRSKPGYRFLGFNDQGRPQWEKKPAKEVIDREP